MNCHNSIVEDLLFICSCRLGSLYLTSPCQAVPAVNRSKFIKETHAVEYDSFDSAVGIKRPLIFMNRLDVKVNVQLLLTQKEDHVVPSRTNQATRLLVSLQVVKIE